MRAALVEAIGLAILACLLLVGNVFKLPIHLPLAPLAVPKEEPKRKPWLPWRAIGDKATVGGPVAPDGTTEVACDLPVPLRMKNVGGRDGAGLCVFTSIAHAARYQNEPKLVNFQADMRKEPGGGYPSKVDKMIEKYGKGTQYIQYEGNDPSVLDTAIKSGRPVSVTYGFSERYGSGRIAHMVNLVHFDSKWACVLDNNFVEGENCLEWMSRDEFLRRWKMGGAGWAVVLLNPAPPPIPHN